MSDRFALAYSGSELRFQRYALGLQERGIDVNFFAGTSLPWESESLEVDSWWKSYKIGRRLPVEQGEGFSVHRVRLPDAPSIRRSVVFGRSLYRFCTRAPTRPDVVQILGLPFGALPWLVRLRMAGVPVLWTRTMEFERPGNPLKRANLALRVRVPIELASRVVVSSVTMRDTLRWLGVKNSVTVIEHGVDLQQFRPPRSARERQHLKRDLLGLEPNSGVILFVGDVRPRKGVDLLLEAYRRVRRRQPSWHLVVVGPRSDRNDERYSEFGKRLSTLLEDGGAPHSKTGGVTFTGYSERVAEYMRAADLFVIPSRREGMPNVMLEAMASALPVVATSFIGMSPELGTPGAHFLEVDRSPSALANGIEKLTRDRDLRIELGRRARQWVSRRLGIERSLDRYADLYRRMSNR